MLEQQYRNSRSNNRDRQAVETGDREPPRTPFENNPLPGDIDSPYCKLVYLYCMATNETTIDELHDTLYISKLTLLPTLELLVKRDLIERTDDGFAAQ